MTLFQVALIALNIAADPAGPAAVEASEPLAVVSRDYDIPAPDTAKAADACQNLPIAELTALGAHERYQAQQMQILSGSLAERTVLEDAPATYASGRLSALAAEKEKAANDLHRYAAQLLQIRRQLCGY